MIAMTTLIMMTLMTFMMMTMTKQWFERRSFVANTVISVHVNHDELNLNFLKRKTLK